MEYNVVKNEKCKHRWIDNNKKSWPYISVKDAEKIELDMNKVILDIGSKNNNNGCSLNFLGRELLLKELVEKKSFYKKVIGYIPCIDDDGNNYYIRIIGRNSILFIIPLVMAIILLFGSFSWLVFNQRPKIALDENAISYQMPNGMKNENPEEIMIPIFEGLKIEKDSDKVNAGLFNPEGNPCYFEYRVYLKETNETLYQSKLIKPGQGITEFKLNKKFKPGKYEIGISILTSSLKDTKVRMNGGDIPSVLTVE